MDSNSPDSLQQLFQNASSRATSRLELWAELIRALGVARMAELGVYRGDFAAGILEQCPAITSYFMLDPWRHLPDWNKPANQDNAIFEGFFEESKAKTEFAANKRTILRGKTTEVIDQIPDESLDLAYVDADHTLRGVTIDLIRVYPKVRQGGFVGGDDFTRSVWEHKTTFEPTLVFPFAVYFAEAVGATIYALPYSQFCLQKGRSPHFAFVDLTGNYDDIGLRNQFAPERVLKVLMAEKFPGLMRLAGRIKH